MSQESPHYKEGFNDRVDGLEHGKWFKGNVLDPNSEKIQPNICAPHPAFYWNEEQKREYVRGYRDARDAINAFLMSIRKA